MWPMGSDSASTLRFIMSPCEISISVEAKSTMTPDPAVALSSASLDGRPPRGLLSIAGVA